MNYKKTIIISALIAILAVSSVLGITYWNNQRTTINEPLVTNKPLVDTFSNDNNSTIKTDSSLEINKLPKVIATINDEPLTKEEFLTNYNLTLFIAGVNNTKQIPLKPIINQTIIRKLLLKQALAKGYVVNNSVAKQQLITTLESNGKNLTSFQELVHEAGISCDQFLPYYAGELAINDYLNATLTKDIVVAPEETREYYDNHSEEFTVPDEIRVSHILVSNYSVAQNIIQQLDLGANFSELAINYSKDPSANVNGDLGFIYKGLTVPEFEKAAFSLKEVSDYTEEPVKLSNGYDIIKLTGRKGSYVIPYESVKDKIYELIYEYHRNEAVTQFISYLYNNYNVSWKV